MRGKASAQRTGHARRGAERLRRRGRAEACGGRAGARALCRADTSTTGSCAPPPPPAPGMSAAPSTPVENSSFSMSSSFLLAVAEGAHHRRRCTSRVRAAASLCHTQASADDAFAARGEGASILVDKEFGWGAGRGSAFPSARLPPPPRVPCLPPPHRRETLACEIPGYDSFTS